MSNLPNSSSVHLIGIGGSGMSALAEILLERGFSVSGSDQQESKTTRRLAEMGARVSLSHSRRNLGQASVVAYSTAISHDNPELIEARKRNLQVLHRAELLSKLMHDRSVLTVAGTHGKTTTAAMIGWILRHSGLDPTVVLGAILPGWGTSAVDGKGPWFVVEADESDRSFLKFCPDCAVITNVDLDHMNEYRDSEDLEETFLRHMNSIRAGGRLVACIDSSRLKEMLSKVHHPVVSYGLGSEATYWAADLRHTDTGVAYRLCGVRGDLGRVELSVPGRHNVLNSLGAVSVCLGLDISFESIKDALRSFKGVERRLQRKGESRGVTVLDDYAHHPAEVRAALEACRASGRRIVVLFQPHRFSRTRLFMSEFAESLAMADKAFLVDVYAAGESPIEGVTSRALAEAAGQLTYLPTFDRAVEVLKNETRSGDLLITMGAGDVWKIGEAYLEEDK